MPPGDVARHTRHVKRERRPGWRACRRKAPPREAGFVNVWSCRARRQGTSAERGQERGRRGGHERGRGGVSPRGGARGGGAVAHGEAGEEEEEGEGVEGGAENGSGEPRKNEACFSGFGGTNAARMEPRRARRHRRRSRRPCGWSAAEADDGRGGKSAARRRRRRRDPGLAAPDPAPAVPRSTRQHAAATTSPPAAAVAVCSTAARGNVRRDSSRDVSSLGRPAAALSSSPPRRLSAISPRPLPHPRRWTTRTIGSRRRSASGPRSTSARWTCSVDRTVSNPRVGSGERRAWRAETETLASRGRVVSKVSGRASRRRPTGGCHRSRSAGRFRECPPPTG